jgi:hypothetical protein
MGCERAGWNPSLMAALGILRGEEKHARILYASAALKDALDRQSDGLPLRS